MLEKHVFSKEIRERSRPLFALNNWRGPVELAGDTAASWQSFMRHIGRYGATRVRFSSSARVNGRLRRCCTNPATRP